MQGPFWKEVWLLLEYLCKLLTSTGMHDWFEWQYKLA